MNRKTKITLICTGAALSVLFAFLLIPSSQGGGYNTVGSRSYGGSGFSYYNFGYSGNSTGVTVFKDGASVRNGSVGGPKHSGRGLSGGK
ncbi:hypothetical protein RYZ26_09945 [Terasakiella sp. A23]|uniref:hypothetical protein n=1 Tax=Terasakiella sp. FCG-A23 TaxID=3080561 RepID=UPI002955BCEF|nr:hypothetical protein [Terasakiella sp. A23]MDV7339916.1 hypothetical protein [Terasakiella sp. A23]